MASQKLDDCYFYYYSSCTKGDDCPYRHCKLALGSEVVCTLWREGRCFRSNCKFRHMESQVNRSAIPCYWENQPGGCRKPHCVFFHRKLRSGVSSDPRLILPVSNGNSSPIPSDPKNPNSPAVAQSPSSPQGLANDLISEPASVPVPRLVLSFDEGEESDTESVSSTPVKPSDDNKNLQSDPAKRNLNSKFAAKTDFGIKTLEQIRMEKIHKESNHYYSGYDAPSLESPHSIEQHSNEYYPPQSDFISLPSSAPVGKSLVVPSKEVTQQSLDLESDLRTRLFKRVNRKAVADVQVVNNKLQQKKKSEESPKDLNFKIKTLEEIRLERENKRGLENGSAKSSSDLKVPSIENKSEPSDSLKSSKKLKITRKSKELYAKAAAIASNVSEREKSLLVYSTTQEKRKSEDSESNRLSKSLKVDSDEVPIQNGSLKQVVNKNQQAVQSLGSFLRRSKPKTSPSSDKPSAPLTPEANDNKENDDITMSSVSADPVLENIESASPIDQPSSISTTTPLIESHSNDQLSPAGCFEPNSTPEDSNLEMSSATDSEKAKDANVEMETSVSVDEFDSFLNEGDMDDEEGEDSAYGDDILLEVEQFLDS